MDESEIFELETKSLFVGMTLRQLIEVRAALTSHRFTPGEIIIHEGDTNKTLYILRSGKVEIISSDRNGEKVVLAALYGGDNLLVQYGGDFFGEMSLFDFEPRSATVIAAEPTSIWQLTQPTLLHLFAKDQDMHIIFLSNLVRMLSRRLRQTNRAIPERQMLG